MSSGLKRNGRSLHHGGRSLRYVVRDDSILLKSTTDTAEVHGVMNGELMKSLEDGQVELEEFEIW